MRKVIEASEGKIFTNGEVYGKTIYLAEGMDESSFYEITEEELEAIQAEADTEDYKEALQKLGVDI
jgi:hypothetical protein